MDPELMTNESLERILYTDRAIKAITEIKTETAKEWKRLRHTQDFDIDAVLDLRLKDVKSQVKKDVQEFLDVKWISLGRITSTKRFSFELKFGHFKDYVIGYGVQFLGAILVALASVKFNDLVNAPEFNQALASTYLKANAFGLVGVLSGLVLNKQTRKNKVPEIDGSGYSEYYGTTAVDSEELDVVTILAHEYAHRVHHKKTKIPSQERFLYVQEGFARVVQRAVADKFYKRTGNAAFVMPSLYIDMLEIPLVYRWLSHRQGKKFNLKKFLKKSGMKKIDPDWFGPADEKPDEHAMGNAIFSILTHYEGVSIMRDIIKGEYDFERFT